MGNAEGKPSEAVGDDAAAEGDDGSEGPAPKQTNIKITHNVSYVPGRPEKQRGYTKQALDVYQPEGDPPPGGWPVLIHIHGGGWRRGDRAISWFGSPPLCTSFAENGVLAFAPSYRVQNWLWHQADCQAAIEWAFSIGIEAFGGNPRQVYLSGHSAGGNIVALCGCGGDQWLPSPLRQQIRGIVCISGIYTLADPFDGEWVPIKNKVFQASYIRGSIAAFKPSEQASQPYILLTNSPSYYLQKHLDQLPPKAVLQEDYESTAPLLHPPTSIELMKRTPFLILNASWDLGLGADGKFMESLLTELQVPCQYEEISGCTHASVCWTPRTVECILNFVKGANNNLAVQ